MITTELILGINKQDLRDAYAIRRAVFCEEQKIPESIEADGLDSSAIHVVAYTDGVPTATGRLLVIKEGYVISRVAVQEPFRGKGLGDLVVRVLIRTAFSMGGEQQIVHAQLSVQGFYKKLGFIPKGEIYEEAGIAHISMLHKGDVYGKCDNFK